MGGGQGHGRGRRCPRVFSYRYFPATLTGQASEEKDAPFCAGQAIREEKGKSKVVAELGTTEMSSNTHVATNWSTQACSLPTPAVWC